MLVTSINQTNLEKEQFNQNTKKFVRNSGSYVISDIVGKIQNISGDQFNLKTAVISGAGLAGLASAFELNAKGFNVVIVESRRDFSRYNIVNLNKEVQAFLKKFNLLEEFEISVAARIHTHQIVVFGKETRQIDISTVSELQFIGHLPKDYMKFIHLFMENGIYSVQIKDLQAFLAHKAAILGIKILSESEIKFQNPIISKRISKIEIIKNNDPSFSLHLNPELLFIAEGAHSSSVQQLGMGNDIEDIITNDCTGENWIFGNLNYQGDKTFVISMIITSNKILQIANVIFNAKNQIVNVAVTSKDTSNQANINRLVVSIAKKAFQYAGIKEVPDVLETIQQPVRITNRIASQCSIGNVFRIGDAAAHSSPLAGLGATLALSLVPVTIEQLLKDYLNKSPELHNNFKKYTQAYARQWINKSQSIKKNILDIFEYDQSSSVILKDTTQNKEVEYAN